MEASRSPALVLGAYLLLFLGGAAVGLGLARALAPESWLAEAVSFFALPVAFASALQAWYGLALLSLVPRLLGWLRGAGPAVIPGRPDRPHGLPGSFVFLPFSSAAGALTGIVVALVATGRSAWVVLGAYWLVGTAHGLLAWRLARAGVLIPPETA